MPHDGYLKLWQLRQPNLQSNHSHHVLMLDEGQDMNPAMLDVFMRQQTTKVIVGDPNQQIYMFRGAINALNSVEATQTYHLTQSFRFGPRIAYAANCCLDIFQKIEDQTLVGGRKKDFLINRDEIKDINDFKPIAIIGRTNLGLFNEVVKLICDAKNPPSACFAGGLDNYNFKDLLILYYLFSVLFFNVLILQIFKMHIFDFLAQNQRERMTKWKGFQTFEKFKAFAKNTNDNELIGKIKTVEIYKERIPGLLEKIKSCCKSNPKAADYIFTTTHKAKGLEWKTVVLLNDFFDIPNGLLSLGVVHNDGQDDEKNILYVAMTRAKQYLALNFTIYNLLVTAKEPFEKVIYLTDERAKVVNAGDQDVMKCLECLGDIVQEVNALGLEKFCEYIIHKLLNSCLNSALNNEN
jgi:F-box protein 18 (helicase)